jgi:hypothetical protein
VLLQLVEISVEGAESLSGVSGGGWRGKQGCPSGFHESFVELAEQVGEAQAQGRDEVAVRTGHASNEAASSKPSEVVGHLAGSVGIAEKLLDERSQVSVSKAIGLQGEVTEGLEESHDSAIPKAQSGDAVAVAGARALQVIEFAAVKAAIVGDALGIQQALVDVVADRLELPQVGQSLSDAEVHGLIDGRLGAESFSLFEVLFDVTALVLDVETRVDVGRDDSRSVAIGWRYRAPGETARKEQPDAIWTTEVEIPSNDLVEEVAAIEGAPKDVSEAQFDLPEAQLVVEASSSVVWCQRPREMVGPSVEERLDLLGPQSVSQLLKARDVLA